MFKKKKKDGEAAAEGEETKEAPAKEAGEAKSSEGGAEGEVIENGEGAPKKGKKKLVFIAAAVLVLAIGAGLFFSGVLGGGAKKEGGEASAESGEHKEGSEDAKKEEGDATDCEAKEGGGHGEKGKEAKDCHAGPIYYELPQFLVNLNSANGRASFLKMSVTLELKNQAAVATMNANKPRIVDTFNTYLRELKPSDIQGSAGIYHLRTELMARLNGTIEEGLVKDILFGEIIVQ